MAPNATIDTPSSVQQNDALDAGLSALLTGPRNFPPAWAVPLAVGTLHDAANPSRAGFPRPTADVAPAPVFWDRHAKRFWSTTPAVHASNRTVCTEGPTWYASVGPGRIRIGHYDPADANRTAERAIVRHQHVVAEGVPHRQIEATRVHAARLIAMGLGVDPESIPESVSDPLSPGKSRSRITAWSKKSQQRMREVYSCLDFAPLLGEGVPALVTGTMPREWEAIAPNGRAFKALVRSFQERYERAWGHRLRGLWKLEFQDRGAPHIHVLMVLPLGTAKASTLHWRDWFAENWADLCVRAAEKALPGWWDFGAMRESVRRVHRHVTASADYAEGARASDPKRIAVYFSMHSLKRNKEYQHVVPAAWQGPGDGPGRFWGYWGLERADRAVPLSDAQAVYLGRVLRRWQHSKRARAVRHVPRVDTATGVVKNRTVRRRVRGFAKGTAGWLLVNDGPDVALMLADSLRVIRRD